MYCFERQMKIFASFFLLTACLATGMFAQDISGTIGGTVLDPSGAAVPSAKVTITNTDRNQVVRTVTTDAAGTYSAPLLPVGNYSIKVEATGFKTETRTGIVAQRQRRSENQHHAAGGRRHRNGGSEGGGRRGRTRHARQRHHHRRHAGARTGARHAQLRATGGADAGRRPRAPPTNSTSATRRPAGTAATLPYSVNGNRNSGQQLDRGWRRQRRSRQQSDPDDVPQRRCHRANSRWSAASTPPIPAARAARRSTWSPRAAPASSTAASTSFSATTRWHANNCAQQRQQGQLTMRQPDEQLQDQFHLTCAAKFRHCAGTISAAPSAARSTFPANTIRTRTRLSSSTRRKRRRIITYTTFNPTLPTAGDVDRQLSASPSASRSLPAVCPAGGAPVTQIPANLINPNAAAYIKDIFGKLPLSGANTRGGHHVRLLPAAQSLQQPAGNRAASTIPSTRSS